MKVFVYPYQLESQSCERHYSLKEREDQQGSPLLCITLISSVCSWCTLVLLPVFLSVNPSCKLLSYILSRPLWLTLPTSPKFNLGDWSIVVLEKFFFYIVSHLLFTKHITSLVRIRVLSKVRLHKQNSPVNFSTLTVR